MIDAETARLVRLLVNDIHSHGSIVQIYQVAREIPALGGGRGEELTELIAAEAVHIRANVSWDRSEWLNPNG